ncbi:two-component response regulator ORR42 [Sorghum bicolor]|nr:two-component response regulator ORR42 [Sorghum bicolor]|eukprot:XP_002447496.2 two-component response regulator ORR42 [Sorghum bicolor]
MASRNQGSAPRALVVEDIKVDCVILMHMLHKLNYVATAVENGKEAIDLFVEGKTFDIVFLDKDMPIMLGPKTVAKIRAMGATKVKIVGVSTDFGAREAFMQAGADVFVPKLMKLETLEAMLQVVISKKNMSS